MPNEIIAATIGEGLREGYRQVVAPPAYRTAPPTFSENVKIIASEVVPAILGGMALGPLGAGWGALGAAGFGGLGNIYSQKFRVDNRLQDDFSYGELAAATAASFVPVGKASGIRVSTFGSIAEGVGVTEIPKAASRLMVDRTLQGAGIATAELTARVGLERGELPTVGELQTTLLFGGAFGGTLGAIEAKYLRTALDTPTIREGDTRVKVLGKVKDDHAARGSKDVQEKFNFMEELDADASSKQVLKTAEEGVDATLREQIDVITAKRAAGEELTDIEKQMELNLTSRVEPESVVSDKKSKSRKTRSAEKAQQKVESATTKAEHLGESPFPELPQGLSKALPRYRNYMLAFESDVDRALYITGGRGKSKAHEGYKEFLDTAFKTKKKAAEIAKLQKEVKAEIAKQTKGKTDDNPIFIPSVAIKKPSPKVAKEVSGTPEVKATKGAIRKAKEVEVDIAEVTGTGAKGQVTIKDVLAHRAAFPPRDAAARAAAKAPARAAEFPVGAVKRRNLDEKGGKLYLPDGKPVNRKNVEKRLRRAEADLKKRYDRKARLEALPDDADVTAVRTAEGIGDSRSVTKKDALFKAMEGQGEGGARGGILDSEQFIQDLKDGLAHVEGKAPSKLKQTLIPSAIAAGAGFAVLTDDDVKAIASQASIAQTMLFLFVAGIVGTSASRILRNAKARRLKDPKVRKEVIQHMPHRNNGDTRGDELRVDAADPSVIYRDKSFFKVLWDETKSDLSHALNPMSRVLKNIDAGLARIFRDHERHISKTKKKYIDEVEPFVVAMTSAIKGNVMGRTKNKADWKAFRLALRNAEEEPARESLATLMKKYNSEVLAHNRKKYKRDEGATQSYHRMNAALKSIREYARRDGGIELGERAYYFPSALKDYNHFKRQMVESGTWAERDFDEIDKAIAAYEEKWKAPPSPEEQSEIATRVLLRKPQGQGGVNPSPAKQRTLELVDKRIIDAYADPAEVMSNYVSKMVTAVERRKFLNLNLPKRAQPQHVSRIGQDLEESGFVPEGDVLRVVRPYDESDLGLNANYEDSIGAYVMRQREKGAWNITDEQAETVSKVINARFNSRGLSKAVGFYKNVTYISLLGNFGAAITQLGDIAYSIHFNGLGNTFRAMFDKTQRDWYKRMGLDSSDIDLVNSRDGLSKVLNHVLNLTQFKRLDKFGKNTVMKSTFVRMSREAKSNPKKLLAELEPIYGSEISNKIRNDLLTGNLSDDVESVIWYKFLDLQPAAMSEMPMGYAQGNRLLYTLKTFTIKQWDVFREASKGHIGKAIVAVGEGNHRIGAEEAAKGIAGLTALSAWFAAMNGGTSILKDTLYGRETNYADLRDDLVYRLGGASRYLGYQARIEGPAKATLEFLMPATTAWDRAWKDLSSLAAAEAPVEVYRGMPIGDFYYWHHGGGREKTRREIAKIHGIPLERVPK